VPLGTTAEHRATADAVQAWARSAAPVSVTRAQESDPSAWQRLWPALTDLGVLDVRAAGGTVTDLAVLLEQCAAVLAPGPVLGSALAALVSDQPHGAVALALDPVEAGGGRVHGSTMVLDAGAHAPVLLPARDAGVEAWYLVPADAAGVKLVDRAGADLSRPMAELHLDGVEAPRIDRPVRDLAVTLMAAEAGGVAAWCLRTAVEYAKVREQFGAPIGTFQAVKHLCAEMLCRVESIVALAWDAAEAAEDAGQHPLAVAVAAATVFDATVAVAKDCIQVLGGVGFTWEHDAHLYLRRAVALRALAGDPAGWRRRVAELARGGARRALHVDLGTGEDERAAVHERVGTIARLAEGEQRAALADAGYLAPHWPPPHGLGAGAAHQVVIDEELARAGITRPDLVIAGWAIPTVLSYGTPAQIDRFVAPTLRGEITWCQLFSEPDAGSDLASLRTWAERVDGGWSLTGQKVWTSLAHRADWAICLARTNLDAPKHKGISYFLVDMRSSGLDIRPLREITGDAMFNEVFLDDVFVPDDCVVGDVDGGWQLARATLANERVAMGHGSSIGEDVERLLLTNGNDERLGALVAEGLSCSLLDLRATLRQLDGRDPGAESSVRKLVGVRHRQNVAEYALDLLGTAAASDSPELREFLLTRCLSIAGGTTQVLLTVAAERVLGLPRG
jgi:3-oxochol-4-en-24-oyl-CoA dehydrogenase